MALTAEDREYVIQAAVEILRHPNRDRLLRIVVDRLEADRYQNEHERELDRVVYALSRTIHDDLSTEP
ncbi:MAG TPA: hypothetical protein PLJ27_23490 [Polyangiaceae bacterium]|jgi:hypothetical protein|nr:MAG: hypothetical protein BWY17_04827 [Deltaproteobacteria bacterium ADurb.Bin207]HNT00359.1 hypothetical protein [Polyangiaceae bacterium]HNZ21005.1 hypothetical protein [Polyangiaceae bacterium]HOD25588.1 hypothetical protein [Polyangiaceae bacterium]HOE48833.1 hypothetical protein [Polyangiaceae bacterium]